MQSLVEVCIPVYRVRSTVQQSGCAQGHLTTTYLLIHPIASGFHGLMLKRMKWWLLSPIHTLVGVHIQKSGCDHAIRILLLASDDTCITTPYLHHTSSIWYSTYVARFDMLLINHTSATTSLSSVKLLFLPGYHTIWAELTCLEMSLETVPWLQYHFVYSTVKDKNTFCGRTNSVETTLDRASCVQHIYISILWTNISIHRYLLRLPGSKTPHTHLHINLRLLLPSGAVALA